MSQKKAMKKQEEEEEEGVDEEGFQEFIIKARYELLEGIYLLLETNLKLKVLLFYSSACQMIIVFISVFFMNARQHLS